MPPEGPPSGGWVDEARLATARIAPRLAKARPFGHVVIDDAVPAAARDRLLVALDDEPADRTVDEIYELVATSEPLEQPDLLQFSLALEAALRPQVEVALGTSVGRLGLRGYRFGPGHFLLPHADADADARRQLAVVVYLAISDDLEGGELELFETQPGPSHDRHDFSLTISSGCIAPRPGRLVLIDVGPTSLHQVREVTAGHRVSLSGWFRRAEAAP